MKYLLPLFILVTIVASGRSQAQETQELNGVNFTGKWRSVSITRCTGMALPPVLQVEVELTLSQSGNELRLIDKTIGQRGLTRREANYYLDGRGELNEGETRSKTTLEGRKLRIQFLTGELEERLGTNDWELSDDGEILTIETQYYSPACRDDRTVTMCPTENHTFRFKRIN